MRYGLIEVIVGLLWLERYDAGCRVVSTGGLALGAVCEIGWDTNLHGGMRWSLIPELALDMPDGIGSLLLAFGLVVY